MLIRILAIGHNMPSWITEGYQTYAKRCAIALCEIPAEKRPKNADISRIIDREGKKLLTATKSNHRLIALDVKGQQWTTEQLASHLVEWQRDGSKIDFLIGGPDGLSKECLDKAHIKLSLSSFTLPHPLVRIVLAEQLYRAWSILKNHPYHRA